MYILAIHFPENDEVTVHGVQESELPTSNEMSPHDRGCDDVHVSQKSHIQGAYIVHVTSDTLTTGKS